MLPNAVIPVHARLSAAIGGPSLWVEQRYWLGAACIHNAVDWRKLEEARGIIPRIETSYGLQLIDHDCLINRDTSQHLPMLMSIRGLGCWLTERWHMSRVNGRPPSGTAAHWPRFLGDYFSAANISLLELETGPSITVRGVTLKMERDGTVDLSGLSAAWPGGLANDWGAIVAAVGWHALEPLPPSLVVPLFDLYRFAALRLHFSTQPRADTVLRKLVAALVNVSAFLVEMHVHNRVLAHDRAFHGRDNAVTELLGPSDRYRCHGNVAKRMSWLERMDNMGSDEAIAKAVSGTSSVASAAVACRNELYWGRSVEVFSLVHRVSVGWDGSNHGGREVVCGYGAEVRGRAAAVLRPKAWGGHHSTPGVTMGKGRVGRDQFISETRWWHRLGVA